MYSPSINNLINELKKLPSVGQHTAERYVFYWLKSGKKDVTELMLALRELIENVRSCEICFDFSDTSPCAICANSKRDHATLLVVTDPQDLQAIENTSEYKGVYHVLRSLIDSTDETSLSRTKINELFKRVQNEPITEIIFALNPSLAGETTALFLEREIKKLKPTTKLTRLARGLPMGSDLQYADEITLSNALKGRTER
jgi:recombination protein RecR